MSVLNENGLSEFASILKKELNDLDTDTVNSTLSAHLADNSNPHNVTASQVGAYTKSETDSAISAAKPANATTSAAGLMSASDKSKLDGINTANLITTSNISSQSVNYADSAGNASTVGGVSYTTSATVVGLHQMCAYSDAATTSNCPAGAGY